MNSKTIILPKALPCISISGPLFNWIISFELAKIWDRVYPEDRYPITILDDDIVPVKSLVNKVFNLDTNPNWLPAHVRLNTTSGQSEIYLSTYADSERCIENTVISDHLNTLYDIIYVLIKDVKTSNPCMNAFLKITGDPETDNLIEQSIYNCATKILNSIEAIHTDELLQIMPFCGIIEHRIKFETGTKSSYFSKASYMKIIANGDDLVLK